MADVKKMATRDGYGKALVELGKDHADLVVLDADLAGSTKTGMFAAHYKLDNLCVIIDNNGLQIDGNVADVMSPYPYKDKLEGFGFHVEAINGHDFEQIEAALNVAKTVKGKPTAIVMSTVKGKDVSFMENNAGWHGVAPNDAQYEQAMAELNAKLTELEGM